MYAPNCKYYILRHIPAFFGSLTPIVMYGIAREVGASPVGAFFAALMIIVDIFNVMEARYDGVGGRGELSVCMLCVYAVCRWCVDECVDVRVCL